MGKRCISCRHAPVNNNWTACPHGRDCRDIPNINNHWKPIPKTIKQEGSMKLKNTEKLLTPENILYKCERECEKRGFLRLMEWLPPGYNQSGVLYVDQGRFLDEFLSKHQDLQDWLIQKGFAEEDKPKFEPVALMLNSEDEVKYMWNLLTWNLCLKAQYEYKDNIKTIKNTGSVAFEHKEIEVGVIFEKIVRIAEKLGFK